MIIQRLFLLAVAALLSACATGPRVIDTLVTTQAAHAPGADLLPHARYRFADDASVVAPGEPPLTQLQALAAAALARVGLVRDAADATLTAQVGGQTVAHWVYTPSFGYPGWGYPGWGYPGWGYGGWGYGGWGGLPDATQYLLSEVSLTLRDIQTGQIVYDTRARHDGLNAGDGVFTALFAAALQGFPTPPAGTRRVDIPLIPLAEPQAGATPSAAAAPAPTHAPGVTPAIATPVPSPDTLTPGTP